MILQKYISIKSVKLLALSILINLICNTQQGIAQQDPLYTQYMFNTLAYNPAYAGSRDVLSIMALSRHQWVGFEGAPSTQTLTAHSPFGEKVGLGLTITHDQLDPVQQTGIYVDYAYRLRVSDNGLLAFGLKGGLNFYQNNLSKLSTGNINDDPALNGGDYSKTLPNFGFGVYYYSKRFYLGASVPKLLENKLNNGDIEVLGESGQEARHYFITSGLIFDLNNHLIFKPSILARITQAAPFSMDINANFLIKEKLWVGGFYRIKEAFGGILQYQVTNQLKVGYGYDMTTSELSNYNSGSHEIMLQYELSFTKDKVQCPRLF